MSNIYNPLDSTAQGVEFILKCTELKMTCQTKCGELRLLFFFETFLSLLFIIRMAQCIIHVQPI